MQAPFWKEGGNAQKTLVKLFAEVVQACGTARVGLLVVPLVDNGGLTKAAEHAALKREMLALHPMLVQTGVRIAFEADLEPEVLAAFIAGFPSDRFGINYDMGNSASLGWDPEKEIPLLASRIINVHVKDRLRRGGTVPLGDGAADLPRQFTLLRAVGYNGKYILQTARAANGDHQGVLHHYAKFTTEQLDKTNVA